MARKKKLENGRPAYIPTPEGAELVKILATTGMTQEQIAPRLGISPSTLRKYYGDPYNFGWMDAMKKATDVVVNAMDNPSEALDAAKFFLTRRGRGLWSETKNVEVSGPNGGAIPVKTVDLDALDYEELEQLEAILSQAVIEGEVVDAEDED